MDTVANTILIHRIVLSIHGQGSGIVKFIPLFRVKHKWDEYKNTSMPMTIVGNSEIIRNEGSIPSVGTNRLTKILENEKSTRKL